MAGCRHPDIHRFGEIRCCLSCGEAVFETPEGGVVPDPSGSPYYCYTPLRHTLGQEIRLIVLHMGRPSDDLICDIIIVNLADRPAYEAVSYTWADADGDRSTSSEILCRGKSIPITKNCDAALRRLRLRGRRRQLWVDAISINQSDTSEKNHQVRLMSKIYTNAPQVLAYLGVQPHSVTNGLQRIIDFLKDENALVLHDSKTKWSLLRFFQLPYFDRVWILQEVGLSQLVTFIIGADEVRWTGAVISKTLNLSMTLDLRPPSILRWSPASRPEEERDVLAVLSRGRNCSATDPRDKVYVLLGLMHPEVSTQFIIDYSITPVEIFIKVAIHCIQNGRLDILKHVRHGGSPSTRADCSSTPTWVPIWGTRDAFDPPPVQFSRNDEALFASQWQMLRLQSQARPSHELHRGMIIEQVVAWVETELGTQRGNLSLSTVSWRRQISRWADLHTMHASSEQIPGYDQKHSIPSEEVEYLTHHISHQQNHNLTYKVSERDAGTNMDSSRDTSTPTKIPYLKLRAHRLGKITRSWGRVSSARRAYIPHTRWPALGSQLCQACTAAEVSPFAEDAMEQAREDFKMQIELYAAHTIMFEIENSVGFTYGTIQTGFSVWVLYGVDVPFILQEVGDHYELIGDCYLHRAGRPFPCKHCGADVEPWPMQTEIIDLW